MREIKKNVSSLKFNFLVLQNKKFKTLPGSSSLIIMWHNINYEW